MIAEFLLADRNGIEPRSILVRERVQHGARKRVRRSERIGQRRNGIATKAPGEDEESVFNDRFSEVTGN